MKPFDRIRWRVDENGCHICTSHQKKEYHSTNRHCLGYPYIKINGKSVRMNRYIYELNYGTITSGYCVCHTCDNPKCINPEHLFEAPQAINNRDRADKGRNGDITGVKNGRAKLTWDDVAKIRQDNRSHRKIAFDYDVTHHSVQLIKTNKQWKV